MNEIVMNYEHKNALALNLERATEDKAALEQQLQSSLDKEGFYKYFNPLYYARQSLGCKNFKAQRDFCHSPLHLFKN